MANWFGSFVASLIVCFVLAVAIALVWWVGYTFGPVPAVVVGVVLFCALVATYEWARS